MKRLLFFGLSALALTFGVLAASPALVSADAKSEVCKGVSASTGGGGCTDTSGSVQKLINAIIRIFSLLIGIVAVIMIMYGGFKYVTAGGDSNNITSAKNTIMYAVIGLVVAALAQVLVKFVLENVD